MFGVRSQSAQEYAGSDSPDLTVYACLGEKDNYSFIPQYHIHKCTKQAQTLAGT